jgi:hypothetical protein
MGLDSSSTNVRCLAAAVAFILLVGIRAAAAATPATNDIFDFEAVEVSRDIVQVTFSYNYSGDHGATDVYVGVMDIAGTGQDSFGWVIPQGHTKATAGSGRITMVLVGNGAAFSSTGVRISMYQQSPQAGRAESLCEKVFPYTKAWGGGGGSAPAEGSSALPAGVLVDNACLGAKSGLTFLVVTRPLFVPALAPFLSWKASQGFRVGVVTVEWLAASFRGRHLAEKMKTGLHEIRKRSGVRYVLLVGDTEIDPDRNDIDAVIASYDLSAAWNVPTGYYRRISSDAPREVLPSDAYFTEDRDWDPGAAGRVPNGKSDTGEGTFNASLFVGRWPVRRPDEVDVLAGKTRALSATNRILFTRDGTLGNTDVQKWCASEPFKFPFDCYASFDTTRLLLQKEKPGIVVDDRIVDLEDGAQTAAHASLVASYPGIIVGLYHGYHSGITMPGWEGLWTHDFPMQIAQSCLVGTFYTGSTDAYSESVMKAFKGPALFLQPPNLYLFFKGMSEGKSVGEAFWRGAATYVYWPNPITFFGDPSLVVLKDTPGN